MEHIVDIFHQMFSFGLYLVSLHFVLPSMEFHATTFDSCQSKFCKVVCVFQFSLQILPKVAVDAFSF